MAGVANTSPAAWPPLDLGALREALVVPGGFWRDIRVVAETGSTNSDLLGEAKHGLAEGAVLAAETQSAGRGRLGRHWVSPPRAALAFSVLLRPAGVPPARRGWVPLLAGVAVARALRGESAVALRGEPAAALRAGPAVDAWLKWPNDVQVNGAKLAGILAEQAGDAIVVGTGINVSAGRDELPEGATSLALEGAGTDRNRLLAGVLAELERWYLAWTGRGGDADGGGLRQEYQRLCGTLGRQVRVSLPGGATVAGVACEVDRAGRLVIRSASGLVPVSAGDVVHVR
jgi:BirA family transcriptional regulator, biotin operon repressor / biotin---[acetyl-CoA-carboxylase] ligase